MKIYITIFILCFISFFTGWIYGDYKAVLHSHIDILEKTETIHSYIKPNIKDYDELFECYHSDINIDGTMKDHNTLSITAYNDCRKSERNFTLGSRNKNRNNSIHFNYAYIHQRDKSYSQYSIMYKRRIGVISAGLGIVSSTDSIGFQTGIGYHF